MMNRRTFLLAVAGFGLAPAALANAQNLRKLRKKNTDPQATSRYIIGQAMRQARIQNWDRKPIGELMGHLGLLLVGTPYVGGTLEGDGPEVCRIDMTGLDCVTFFENVLAMARCAKKGTTSFEDVVAEVRHTRYRDGVLTDYTSRLHYTAEWIADNVRKNVVTDVTPSLGGEPFPVNVSFMSEHPKYYAPLRDNEQMRLTMAAIEQKVNAIPRTWIPKADIARVEPMLRTGDIVAIATSKEGLDYAHTGMVYVKPETGVAHLLHASSQKKKVVLDGPVHEYVNSVRSHSGITVVRPTEVQKA